MFEKYICTLDIGSSKIVACVAVIKSGKIANFFFDSISTKGFKEGSVVNSIELVNSVSRLLKGLKAKSGIGIKYLYTNISGKDIVTKHSRAIMPLAERGNKVVTISDIDLVNEQARILGSSLEDEIVHLIPAGYSIDSKAGIANPVGLYSHRLEVDLYLICAKLSSIQTIGRVIHQSGYEIRNLFYSGLATSRAVFDKELNEGINVFCDIGSDITELLIFKDGMLSDIINLTIGGDDLTKALQENLKIPFELAEEIKKTYGIVADIEQIKEDKEILVKKSSLYKPIKQKAVSAIITDATKLMCSQIREAISQKIACYQVNSFVVAGRSVLLEGFIETLETSLSIPVKLGRIVNPVIPLHIKENELINGQHYLAYLTALGMLSGVLQGNVSAPVSSSAKAPAKNFFAGFLNRFKELYQEYF